MKAVVLAGGKGTRLRPLTCSVPKPLLPVVNIPMLLRLIQRLPSEVDEVIVTVSYMAEEIERALDSWDLSCKTQTVMEVEPLGTGGAIKNVESFLTDKFMVLNADIITTMDIVDYMNFHEKKGGIGTVSLFQAEDPTRFGMAEQDDDLRIDRFVEKPKLEEVTTNWINAGAYLLEREVLDFIPPEKFVSMESEIFPQILEKGLYGYRYEGLWIDAGTPESYLEVHRKLLEKEDLEKPEHFKNLTINNPQKTFCPPLHMGSDCTIADGAVLGSFTCMGDSVKVGVNSVVRDSVLYDLVEIGANCVLEGAILGKGATVGDNVKISRGCVLQDGVSLESGKTLEEGRTIGRDD